VKIIKRDGRTKIFQLERIHTAISKAYLEVYNDLVKFQEDYIFLEPMIMKDIENLKSDTIDIESVQNIVISNLYKLNGVVAKAYENYRNKRNEEREKNSSKERYYKEVLECTNIDNDNANVDQHSFSGRKYRIADNEQKLYAIRNLLNPTARKAFEDASIYHHDLSSYAIGDHNCLFADLDNLLDNGFETRNGDVRTASCFSTACQLIAVIFQCQSQVQYGGVASNHLDFTLAKFVRKSFIKHFKDGFFEKYDAPFDMSDDNIYIDNEVLKHNFPKAYDYAIRHLEKEGRQSCESLYHNLNTLESRAGSQLPFDSVNLGRDTSTEGKLVNKWIFNASLNGIGKFGRTSIFPISIFQYKKGVNAKEGDVNYELKKLAIKSLSKRIYPNFVNGDWKKNIEDPNNPDTYNATMGELLLLISVMV
jgi:anaerobic ribonucleoside-triphosphate reductase